MDMECVPMKMLQPLLLVLAITLLPATLQAESPTVFGRVVKIDLPAGKITISAGPIPNLEMPAMTMVFKVADPKFLTLVKPGDKIKFSAEHIDNQFVITAIQPR
jgi:Cu(I)/Ag(I) efflux system protein CusF